MVGAFYRGFQTLTLFKGNKLKMDTLFFKGNKERKWFEQFVSQS